jgi:hypothetical protein
MDPNTMDPDLVLDIVNIISALLQDRDTADTMMALDKVNASITLALVRDPYIIHVI